jgi:hypothetical protein
MRVFLVLKGRREGRLLMQSSTRRNWLVTTSYLFPGPKEAVKPQTAGGRGLYFNKGNFKRQPTLIRGQGG